MHNNHETLGNTRKRAALHNRSNDDANVRESVLFVWERPKTDLGDKDEMKLCETGN